MSPRLLLRCLGSAALSFTLLTLPATAHAEKEVTRDPAGDVLKVELSSDDESAQETYTPAPGNRPADIVRTVIDHRKKAVRISVRLRRLDRSRSTVIMTRLVTSKRNYDLMYFRMPAQGGYLYGLSRGMNDIPCPGLRRKLDPARATVTFTVPRTCLGDPRWIRAGVAVGSGDMQVDLDTDLVVFADESHRVGKVGDQPKVSARLRRD